jgi:hypothetical protein
LNRSNKVLELIQAGPAFQPLTSGGLNRSWPIRRSAWVESGPMFWTLSALSEPTTRSTGDLTCAWNAWGERNSGPVRMSRTTARISKPLLVYVLASRSTVEESGLS